MMGGWGNMMGGWGYGGYGSGGYGMMGMAGIGMHLIFGIGIILLGIYLFRRNAAHVHNGAIGRHSAMDILRERYARGEIDSEEFQSRKRDLESK
ncbi:MULTISPECIES: SHOCT domain-containing protein [Desulfosporosinus]|uniref:SHOCT domain-containing protein n=1 Tax=Desulfosporosinus nitroreducens TaxID=2018668 RepID=A0ABT8QSK7_9FIRM|nr:MULTISPECIES: SHOCT domain-containing protein [Desulfosporosinus]MCO1603441.1 SHOCT domain-containing protein [Desulfosporosinus nitroreducens]MCO5388396.1 SHOCT domain-containing protein [Desulfosporosinus sp.]MDA8223290.1 SHOCT domain-containing protein [Desulfitobacterium hafniense]MDO0824338.1 SHOCT domain-containing protein [Desulfosporosinus nitroreducens]